MNHIQTTPIYFVQTRVPLTNADKWRNGHSSFGTREAAEAYASDIADMNDHADIRVTDGEGRQLWFLAAGFNRTVERAP